MLPYRAWINQPSTLQPYHHLHGKRCIVTHRMDLTATVYFTEGELISTTIPAMCLSSCGEWGKDTIPNYTPTNPD
jgi:hypothetical protein